MSAAAVGQPINVSLGMCKKLRSSRGAEQFVVLAKMEYGGELVGEPNKLECNEKEAAIDLALTATLHCSTTNATDLDELARTPLIVSISEVLPKDKKVREDKVVTIGIASIDLSPLVQGQQSFQISTFLYPTETCGEDEELPRIDVSVSVPVPLLSAEDIGRSNLVFFRVRGLYSLPDSWNTGQSSFTFTVATSKPGAQSVDTPLVMAVMGGEVHGPSDPNLAASKGRWRWPGAAGALHGEASLLPKSLMMVQVVEDESGDLRSSGDIEFRQDCEGSKPRVVWNTETRCFLSAFETEKLMRSLSRCSVWPVEMARVLSATIGKGRSKEDEVQMSMHGVAYMDLAGLLYPGSTRVFGAYPVIKFSEEDQSSRTDHRNPHSILYVVHPKSNTAAPTSFKKIVTSRGRPRSALRHSLASLVGDVVTSDDSKREGQIYTEARSYLLLEMELAKPLVPKRTASPMGNRVSQYISPRPLLRKISGGVEKAIGDFHSATSEVASFLFHEYRILFGDDTKTSNTKQEMEARQHKLIHHLKTSGRYHAFKEHLKKAVLNLVRQKFLNEASVKDPHQLEQFLSKLYLYLVDEMHTGLKRRSPDSDLLSQRPSIHSNDQIKHFSEEAVAMQDMDLADYYYKELLARADHLASHWYEYGVFNLLVNNREKSEQCFRCAISIDKQFVPGLLLYGICVSMDERFSEAEEVFELAITTEGQNIIAWTVRGLYYELCNNSMYRDMCFKKAHQLATAACKEAHSISKESGTGGSLPQGPVEEVPDQAGGYDVNLEPQPVISNGDVSTQEGEPTMDNEPTTLSSTLIPEQSQEASKHEEEKLVIDPFLLTASHLVDVHASKYAEMCLAHALIGNQDKLEDECQGRLEVVKNKDSSVPYLVAMGRLLMMQKQYERAKSYLSRAVKEEVQNSSILALVGHCCYMSGHMDQAKCAYEQVLRHAHPPPKLYVVLLRLADIYLKENEYQKAKVTYLQVCHKSPSFVTWRGVGIACYMMGEFGEAEDALREANMLNNLDPVVWAYLVLLCQHTLRPIEAELALKYAIKTGLQEKNPALFSQLHSTSLPSK